MAKPLEPISNSQIFYWVDNLVGTAPRFTFNLLFSLVGGFLYSFKIWSSPYVLAIFGVVSPLIFTLCLYFLIRLLSENPDNPFPKLFSTKENGLIMMIFDMAIVIIMAVLIQLDVINYLFFRLLQTMIFPALMLIIMRTVYTSITQGDESEDNSY